MSEIARRSASELRPLCPGLSPEVLDWVGELRTVWAATGLSLNQFASLHPIDKGTISRYLSGQRVPRDRWFLEKLMAIRADNGKPATRAVHEHLAALQLRALEAAHPHEYRVRRVSDELEIALTGKLEAERYARALEEQLAERNRQVQQLTEDKGRLRAAWNSDREAKQAEYDRLSQEVGEIMSQLRRARKRTEQAERRCQKLEDLLDHMDTHSAGQGPEDVHRHPTAGNAAARQGAPRQRPGTSQAGWMPGERIHRHHMDAPLEGGWITILEWRHKVGEHVSEWEVVVDVRTETGVDLELPSVGSGVISEIFALEGTLVAAGSPLCAID